MKDPVLIVGATSSIARAIARRFAQQGSSVLLAARDLDEAQTIASDLRVRFGVEAEAAPFDAERPELAHAFFEECLQRSQCALAGVVVAHGDLGDRVAVATDPAALARLVDVNLTSAAAVLAQSANHFEARRTGFICAISSVAGDRGRKSNYAYGAAKAGLTAYLSGLRQRMSKAGVTVLTVKPGFVDTAMTFGAPGLFLVARPERVADDIVRSLRRGRSSVYTPWFWRWIMLIIRSIPEPVFRRLDL